MSLAIIALGLASGTSAFWLMLGVFTADVSADGNGSLAALIKKKSLLPPLIATPLLVTATLYLGDLRRQAIQDDARAVQISIDNIASEARQRMTDAEFPSPSKSEERRGETYQASDEVAKLNAPPFGSIIFGEDSNTWWEPLYDKAVHLEASAALRTVDDKCYRSFALRILVQEGKSLPFFHATCADAKEYQLSLYGDKLFIKPWKGQLFGG